MDGEGEGEAAEPEPEDNSETIERVLGNRRGKKGGIPFKESIKWLLCSQVNTCHVFYSKFVIINCILANTVLNFS